MAEELVKRLVTDIPVLAGVIVALLILIKYMSRRDEVHRETINSICDTFATKASECHEVQRESLQAIVHNTEALVKVETTLVSMNDTMREVRRAVSESRGSR